MLRLIKQNVGLQDALDSGYTFSVNVGDLMGDARHF